MAMHFAAWPPYRRDDRGVCYSGRGLSSYSAVVFIPFHRISGERWKQKKCVCKWRGIRLGGWLLSWPAGQGAHSPVTGLRDGWGTATCVCARVLLIAAVVSRLNASDPTWLRLVNLLVVPNRYFVGQRCQSVEKADRQQRAQVNRRQKWNSSSRKLWRVPLRLRNQLENEGYIEMRSISTRRSHQRFLYAFVPNAASPPIGPGGMVGR